MQAQQVNYKIYIVTQIIIIMTTKRAINGSSVWLTTLGDTHQRRLCCPRLMIQLTFLCVQQLNRDLRLNSSENFNTANPSVVTNWILPPVLPPGWWWCCYDCGQRVCLWWGNRKMANNRHLYQFMSIRNKIWCRPLLLLFLNLIYNCFGCHPAGHEYCRGTDRVQVEGGLHLKDLLYTLWSNKIPTGCCCLTFVALLRLLLLWYSLSTAKGNLKRWAGAIRSSAKDACPIIPVQLFSGGAYFIPLSRNMWWHSLWPNYKHSNIPITFQQQTQRTR